LDVTNNIIYAWNLLRIKKSNLNKYKSRAYKNIKIVKEKKDNISYTFVRDLLQKCRQMAIYELLIKRRS